MITSFTPPNRKDGKQQFIISKTERYIGQLRIKHDFLVTVYTYILTVDLNIIDMIEF